MPVSTKMPFVSLLCLSAFAAETWAQSIDAAQPASRITQGTIFLTLCFVCGFAATMWRNHRRVTRINRELRDLNSRLNTEIEGSRHNQKLREALELRVARAERMESLGLLAGGISHDFNNLLVGVVCNAQLLKRPDLSETAKQRCIEGILTSADKATDLSRKMRAYAGREPAARCSVDLVSLVKNLGAILQSTAKKGGVVEFEFQADEAFAHADQSQTEKILMSLVGNSRDAVDEAGRVIVRVGTESILNIAEDGDLIGSRSNGGEFAYLEVEDTGNGISKEVLGRIFDPFYSTKDGGRGMGLAVVYGLVNRQDGLIRCRSAVGQGTAIRVLLPKALEKDPGALPVAISNGNLPQTGKLVVIDDEPSILEVVSRAFGTLNWTTKKFQSGVEAIPYIEANADNVDCVVLDVVMPKMGGETVVRKLNELGIRIPIVIMSGFSNTNLNDFVSLPNVAATLNKPFSVVELANSVSRAITPADLPAKIPAAPQSK